MTTLTLTKTPRLLVMAIIFAIGSFLGGLMVFKEYQFRKEWAANPYTAEQIEQLPMTPCVRRLAMEREGLFTQDENLTPKRLEWMEKKCASPEAIQREEQIQALSKKS